MISHLVVSTFFLGAMLLAARLLPLTARTRYALLILGMAKLAIPAPELRFARPIVIPMQMLAGGNFAAAAAPSPANPWPMRLLIGWGVIAALLVIGIVIAKWRAVAEVMRTSSAPSMREREAFDDVRRALGIRTAIELVRGGASEAPASLRIIRPLIVLPPGGCDDLSDDELRSLLTHECAHVIRRDNLVGLLESLVAAVFWPHPLVWIAQRSIAAAREEACDETVADASGRTDDYLSAMTKICRAVISPRTAGVSCMAAASLKPRLEHLMRYEELKSKALSHRAVLTGGAAMLLAVTLAAGVKALPSDNTPYTLRISAERPAGGDTYSVRASVIENATKAVVAQPAFQQHIGQPAAMTIEAANGRYIVSFDVLPSGNGTAKLRVERDGEVVQESTYDFTVTNSKWSGAPISMDLQDADIVDLLHTFSQLTKIEMEIAPNVSGRVTLSFKDMPWDEALDRCIHLAGCEYHFEGKKMVVTKK
ncbi:MAG TPA: M56 family metallopeptidase [Thermoanaerobaculia bacterium]|nr:M56 family metallopeptidase [Thermoanaerobaculia bacterium]